MIFTLESERTLANEIGSEIMNISEKRLSRDYLNQTDKAPSLKRRLARFRNPANPNRTFQQPQTRQSSNFASAR
jgi:hypothetical protein